MANGELLQIEPQELQFPFELKKQISCSMQLINKSEKYVAFKVKTKNPKKYWARPHAGVVLPYSTCDVIVTMQAQKEAPPDMQCTDKLLVQSAVTDEGASAKDITPNMFNKEEGRIVENCKLKVAYVAPPQPLWFWDHMKELARGGWRRNRVNSKADSVDTLQDLLLQKAKTC